MKQSKNNIFSLILLSISSLSYANASEPVYGVDYAYYYEDNGKIAFKETSDDGTHSAGKVDVTAENMAIDISKDYTDNSTKATLNQATTYTDTRINDSTINTDTQINSVNNRVNHLDSKIDDNRKRASAGIAGAMAMSAIPQNFSYDFNFGMGMANFDSEQAISAGGYYRVNERTTVSLKTSFDTQNNLGAAAGISYGW